MLFVGSTHVLKMSILFKLLSKNCTSFQGTSMSPHLKVVQMLQIEDCLDQRSSPPHRPPLPPPPPTLPNVQLTEGVPRRLLVRRLMCRQGGDVALRGLRSTRQTSQTLGTEMLRDDYKVGAVTRDWLRAVTR